MALQKAYDDRVTKAISTGKTALLIHECEKVEIDVRVVKVLFSSKLTLFDFDDVGHE